MANVAKSPTPSADQKATSLFVQAHDEVKKTKSLDLIFSRFANRAAHVMGHPFVFLAALVIVLAWAASGPVFRFSDTWQLVINTGTTVITFLVVFLIQNTQNRDAKALHLKLDELIRSHAHAHNDMIDIENLSDTELEKLEERYAAICREQKARRNNKEVSKVS